MALATTTLTSAVSVTDNVIVVAASTSLAAGRLVRIDDEILEVTKAYVAASLTVPVLRGRDGTSTSAHVVTANVTHGLASDFSLPGDQTYTTYPSQRAVDIISITTTPATLTLPKAGSDLRVILNGTAVITLTVPVPTKDMDGTLLTIVGNGAAAHVLTFTGGLSGAGGSYDIITVNATAPIAVSAIACNGLWIALAAIPIAGTVTNVTGTLT